LVLVVIDILYLISVVLLASYGLNAIITVFLFLSHRKEARICPELKEVPRITVQLPVFNELFVLERLVTAAASLDYPRDRLQIQLLDDSTDETTTLAEELVRRYRGQGVNIDLFHRIDRSGFKAGALRASLPEATGEYIAIFDADFVPEPDFLKRTVPHFSENPNLGMIQTRWGHVNGEYSTLTRAQAIALDGHFVVEQTARNRSGLFMNFNGTAGIWRRSCIEAAGGWQTDTICEDLDLSYRAQLGGWDFLFLPDIVVPAEVPPQMNAFKRQQFRWAKGSMQCAIKMWRSVLTAPVPVLKRVQGIMHLTSYSVHPLMVLLLLTTLPFITSRSPVSRYVGFLSIVSLGPPFMYLVGQRTLYPDWLRRFSTFPLLLLIGTGIAWSNTRAIFEAFTKRENQFHRTPKFRVEVSQDNWKDSPYALPLEGDTIGELALALYALGTAVYSVIDGNPFILPFLLIYTAGFGYVAVLGILHSAGSRRKPTAVSAACHPIVSSAASSPISPLPSSPKLYLSQALPPSEEKKPLSKAS
jgi:cellulose synthase/poly-beta-1,6-N-acetylglucosamine synthase-like glycosyltransferase